MEEGCVHVHHIFVLLRCLLPTMFSLDSVGAAPSVVTLYIYGVEGAGYRVAVGQQLILLVTYRHPGEGYCDIGGVPLQPHLY